VLAEIIIITIILTATIEISSINSSQLAYAHNFVPNIAASFLTKINQIRVQTQLVENDIPLNLSLSKQHAEIASELFDNNTQNDLYYNAEGNNNTLAKTISDDVPLALSNLQKAVRMISTTTTASNQSEQQPQQQTTMSSSVIKEIKQMVNNINQLLDKAIPVKIDKFDLLIPQFMLLSLPILQKKHTMIIHMHME
jgi:hypothetical protein